MKVVSLGHSDEERGTEQASQPDAAHTANPPFPQLHLDRAHLEAMGHDSPMEVGKKYEIMGVAHVKGSHEDGGAHLEITHMGAGKMGRAAKDMLYEKKTGEESGE